MTENQYATAGKDSVLYYEENADDFIKSTIHADVSSLYRKFEKYLAKGCRILDLGSGSGRDSKYFTEKGYDVIAVDPSLAMCKRTKEYAGVPTFLMKAEELSFEKQFDAVWACASLLHVPRTKQVIAMHRIYDSMNIGGILYSSWKYGDQDRVKDGRIFTDLDEDGLSMILKEIPGLCLIETWVTSDVRMEQKEQKWLNALIMKNDFHSEESI